MQPSLPAAARQERPLHVASEVARTSQKRQKASSFTVSLNVYNSRLPHPSVKMAFLKPRLFLRCNPGAPSFVLTAAIHRYGATADTGGDRKSSAEPAMKIKKVAALPLCQRDGPNYVEDMLGDRLDPSPGAHTKS
jgi:hypothetical protein